METKPFYVSKTFWFNVLALVVVVAGAFGFAEFQPTPEVETYGLVLVTIANIVLRFVTAKPLAK